MILFQKKKGHTLKLRRALTRNVLYQINDIILFQFNSVM